MSNNRFTDKFKTIEKGSTFSTQENIKGMSNKLLNTGIGEDPATMEIDSDVLSDLNLTQKIKRTAKSYYLSDDITKELAKVAKNNGVSTSYLLEEILRKVLNK